MKNFKQKTCCFTGHRKIPKGEEAVIRERLKKAVISAIESGYIYFGAGGALGFDTLAAQTVLELKKDFPEIKLILVFPHKKQHTGWAKKDIDEYLKIMKESDKFIYTSENYFPGCMHKRNRHLVDHSSLCICYLTEKEGGTFYTVKYAQKGGLKVINVANAETEGF